MYFFKHWFLTIILLAITLSTYSQPFLVLKKEGTFRRSIYQAGDIISFKLKDDKQRKNLVIKELRRDTIVFTGGAVKLDEIGTIYIKNDYRSWNPSTYSYFFIIAGTGYIGLAAVNDEKVDNNTIATSAILVSTGILINLIKRKKVKIEDKIQLDILEKLP